MVNVFNKDIIFSLRLCFLGLELNKEDRNICVYEKGFVRSIKRSDNEVLCLFGF